MKRIAILGLLTVVGAPLANADTHIVVPQHTVVPVVFEDGLNLRENRVGDRFCARVEDGVDLPRGTRFAGVVESVKRARDGRPGFMELRFESIELPDGEKIRISGIPISLQDRHVRRDRDGRLIGVRDDNDRENKVVGGLLGGFALGSIFKKPLEGALIGTIAGIVAAESDKRDYGDVIVKRGQRYGALIETRIDFRWRGEFRPYRDPRDEPSRFDPPRRRQYDPDDDVRRDPSRRPRNDDHRSDDRRNEDRRSDDRRSDDRRDAPAASQIEVRYRDRAIQFAANEAPFWDGDVRMVAIKPCAPAADIKLEEGRSGQWYLSTDAGTLRLTVGERVARWNGEDREISRAVVERNGVIFAPEDAIRLLRAEGFQFSGNRRE